MLLEGKTGSSSFSVVSMFADVDVVTGQRRQILVYGEEE